MACRGLIALAMTAHLKSSIREKGYKYEQEEEIKENLIETNEIDLDNKD